MEPLISVSSFDFHLACFASQSRGDSFLLIEIIDRVQGAPTQQGDVVVNFRSHAIFLLGCIKRPPSSLSRRYYQYLGNSHRRYFRDKNARARCDTDFNYK